MVEGQAGLEAVHNVLRSRNSVVSYRKDVLKNVENNLTFIL